MTTNHSSHFRHTEKINEQDQTQTHNSNQIHDVSSRACCKLRSGSSLIQYYSNSIQVMNLHYSSFQIKRFANVSSNISEMKEKTPTNLHHLISKFYMNTYRISSFSRDCFLCLTQKCICV